MELRGTPTAVWARLMSRISWQISSGTFGLPLRHCDFHHQNEIRSPAPRANWRSIIHRVRN